MAPFVPESSFQLIWDNGFGSKRQARSSLQAPFGAVRQQPHRKSKMSGYCSCHYCFRFGSGSVAFSAALASLRSLVPGGHKKTLRTTEDRDRGGQSPFTPASSEAKRESQEGPPFSAAFTSMASKSLPPPIKADGTFLCPSHLTQCVFLP